MSEYVINKINFGSNVYRIGGSLSDSLTVNNEFAADSATIGDLIVTGGANFTNNIAANTINGVTVGSSPKFTDTNTEVSTLTLAEGSTAGTSLGYGKKYTLTAGSKTVSFTMPASDNTNTASAADNILDGSNSGTQITYAPYTAQQSKLSFDTSTTAPSRTDRLNLNGYLYATKLYSGGTEVSVSGHTHSYLPSNTTYVSTITTTAGTHTAISSKSGAVSFNVPTKTSHLTNDSGFVTSSGVTGSGTSGYLTKWNSSSTVTNGPALGSDTTKFLRNDGTWAVPSYTSDTNTWRKVQLNGTDKLGTGINTNPLNLKAGTNVSISESSGTFTFSATDTTYTFTNKSATLDWGTAVTIATVGGVDITAKLPANPNTDHYAWSDITGKPSTFAPSSHSHSEIVTVGDQRSTATTPNSYSNKIIFQGLKTNSVFGSPSSDDYSYVLGFRGWSDSSGGDSHELAFNNTGIFWRHGATTSWGSWNKVYTAANKPSISDHGTTSVGSASGWSAGSASTWTFESKSIPNVTAVGSGSYSHSGFSGGSGSFTQGSFNGGSGSLTMNINGSDSGQLDIVHTHTAATHGADSHTHTAAVYGTDSHTHTAPTLGTAITVYSKSGGGNGTAPSLTVTSTTVVNGKSHTVS